VIEAHPPYNQVKRGLPGRDEEIVSVCALMNGLTLCPGNFTLMTNDLPFVIRDFSDRIFFVYFRDVRGTPSHFEETWHDAGQTDVLACMRAYRDFGFESVLRPDHAPTVKGDSNENAGYLSFGRLYAIGCIRGLREAVDA
jgi:mannonate dehydratase